MALTQGCVQRPVLVLATLNLPSSAATVFVMFVAGGGGGGSSVAQASGISPFSAGYTALWDRLQRVATKVERVGHTTMNSDKCHFNGWITGNNIGPIHKK
jgi:hypothetical protein